MNTALRDPEPAEARAPADDPEAAAVRDYLVHVSGRAWGISVGVVFGLVLFLATIVLVIRGGENVGAHLKLLSAYLPLYDVTVGGAFIGFGYAFAMGYLAGRLASAVYNVVARP